MKIALVYPFHPFITGGTEILIAEMQVELTKRGHEADIFALPYSLESLTTITEAMVNMKLLKFDGYDKLIICKFPCFYIEHKNITFWIFHQFRQVYELWETEFGYPNTDDFFVLKRLIEKNDNESLNKAKIFVNADEVKKRLKLYNNIESEVLTPPQKDVSAYHKELAGDYIFYPSRVNSFKRQQLLVEAMKYTKTDVKLVIAGKYEDTAYDTSIKQTINRNKLSARVKYLSYFISDDDKVNLFANSLAVANIPYKEDSCGFVTFEAFYSHKPILTCFDSGGTLDFVEDNKTGYITQPNPESIAEAIDKLYNDKENTEQMGENAYEFIVKKNINWEDTIKRLLE